MYVLSPYTCGRDFIMLLVLGTTISQRPLSPLKAFSGRPGPYAVLDLVFIAP